MGDSSYDSDLAALKAIESFIPYIGYAIQAYGFYQTLFGPARKTIDWKKIVAASEKRIQDGIHEQAFVTKVAELKAVSNFWDETCVPFLKRNPISPQNVSGFESYIAISSLRATIATTGGLVDYFAGEKQYATLSALLAANTLRITLLTVLEAYFIAKEGKKSNTNVLSGAIQKTINILQAWPEHYINDRATSLTYEIEQKYSGAADSFGRGRDKHPTGWYILHDSAPDPATGSLEGLRFHHHFPNKVEEVKKRALKALVLAGESLPLPPQPPVDTKTWFRLKSLASPSTSIDVVNDSTKTATDAQLQLAPEGNFSGQFWRFRPSKIVPGQWSLSTMFLGKDMCLDVYGDDKTRPHLAAAGNFSGQQWQLFDRKNGAWSLWNGYSGPDMFLTARSEPGGWLRLAVDARDGNNSSQKWALSPIQPIAEADP